MADYITVTECDYKHYHSRELLLQVAIVGAVDNFKLNNDDSNCSACKAASAVVWSSLV